MLVTFVEMHSGSNLIEYESVMFVVELNATVVYFWTVFDVAVEIKARFQVKRCWHNRLDNVIGLYLLFL